MHDDLLKDASFAVLTEDSIYLTFSEPLSIHCLALYSVMLPPNCNNHGQAERASLPASSLPGPSIIICALVSALF